MVVAPFSPRIDRWGLGFDMQDTLGWGRLFMEEGPIGGKQGIPLPFTLLPIYESRGVGLWPPARRAYAS